MFLPKYLQGKPLLGERFIITTGSVLGCKKNRAIKCPCVSQIKRTQCPASDIFPSPAFYSSSLVRMQHYSVKCNSFLKLYEYTLHICQCPDEK